MSGLLADLLMAAREPISAKAFDFAQDATKQMITLATGIIALTITFMHDVAAKASTVAVHFVEAAWLAYIVSIAFGLMTLLQLAGNLETEEQASIYRGGIVATSLLQIVCFLGATVSVVVFGIEAHT